MERLIPIIKPMPSGNNYSVSAPSQRTHITEYYVIYSHEHYHNHFIILRKLQKRTGDPFSLKAQRKRSPCPIKRGTLKPSVLLATEPLILLHSQWQEETFQTILTRLLHKRC